MVDFSSSQGRSDFATAGVVRYAEDCKRARTQAWAERCRLWIGTIHILHPGRFLNKQQKYTGGTIFA
jgi:hypothetical protein